MKTPAKSAPRAKKTSAPSKAASRNKPPLGHGVGRRKSAVARVWLRPGTGLVLINGRDYLKYFDTLVTQETIKVPFTVVPHAQRYNFEANVEGGGLSAQAHAVQLGMARALLQAQSDLKSLLRQNNLLTVDSRVKERKKYGQKAARRKFQFVKR